MNKELLKAATLNFGKVLAFLAVVAVAFGVVYGIFAIAAMFSGWAVLGAVIFFSLLIIFWLCVAFAIEDGAYKKRGC